MGWRLENEAPVLSYERFEGAHRVRRVDVCVVCQAHGFNQISYVDDDAAGSAVDSCPPGRSEERLIMGERSRDQEIGNQSECHPSDRHETKCNVDQIRWRLSASTEELCCGIIDLRLG